MTRILLIRKVDYPCGFSIIKQADYNVLSKLLTYGSRKMCQCSQTLSISEIDLIIKATGSPKVQEIIETNKGKEAVVVDAGCEESIHIQVRPERDLFDFRYWSKGYLLHKPVI
ncbi:MAG: hypothetical protein PHZ03_08570 [Syntrophomonas sp.]|nr:hypothetical protein [Syntrophomonas sp.]